MIDENDVTTASPSDEDIIINSPEVVYDETNTGDDKENSIPVKRTRMEDLLLIEIKRLVSISKEIQEKINLAKTKAKKTFYTKKLRKNNNALADMLIRLEQYQQAKG